LWGYLLDSVVFVVKRERGRVRQGYSRKEGIRGGDPAAEGFKRHNEKSRTSAIKGVLAFTAKSGFVRFTAW
jgi:hypothetical protein